MSQTRKASAMEACTNIVAGYGVNFLANMWIFPVFGWELSIRQNLMLGAFYTIVSFVRSYLLRRLYNLWN